jgi:hypothetical protein
MAVGRNPTVVALGGLAVVASVLAAWWIWDGERRAARAARRAHLEAARGELAQQLRFAENFQKARVVCDEARRRGNRVPKFCDESGPEAAQIAAETRRAEKAYLAACQACAGEDACARDLAALKAGQEAGRAPTCDHEPATR